MNKLKLWYDFMYVNLHNIYTLFANTSRPNYLISHCYTFPSFTALFDEIKIFVVSNKKSDFIHIEVVDINLAALARGRLHTLFV